MIKVAPSTNPPKPEGLIEYIKELNSLDVDYLHCDIMDGRFVTSSTFGAQTVGEIAKITKLPLDVHLMVKNPKDIKKYAKAGASIITVHLEAFDDEFEVQTQACCRSKSKKGRHKKLIKTLLKIAKLGAIPSVSIKPNTPIEELWPVLGYVGMVLVMSVEPGKSGQEFLTEALNRIAKIKQKLEELGLSDVLIEVDGGVNDKNISEIKKAGADIVVAGNYIYAAKDRAEAISKLKATKSN